MSKTLKTLMLSVIFAASTSAMAGGAPEIGSGAKVSVSKNTASNIVTGGASGSVKTGVPLVGPKVNIDGSGETNVNSLVVGNGGKINGQVNIDGNSAKDIYNIGGSNLNVNSVVLK